MRKRKGFLKPDLLLVPVVGILLAVVLICVLLISNAKHPRLQMLACEADGSTYYIRLQDENTYIDNYYGIPQKYTVENGVYTFEDLTGRKISFGSVPREMDINGIRGEYKLVRREEMPINDWQISDSARVIRAYRSMLPDFGAYIQLYNDRSFKLTVRTEQYIGKYATLEDGTVMLFYDKEGTKEIYFPWAKGIAIGDMGSSVTLTPRPINALEESGYTLEGTLMYYTGDSQYTFYPDNTGVHTDSYGAQYNFLYHMDNNGIVSMTDIAGGGFRDFIYVNPQTGAAYRYVFLQDSWTDYLNKEVAE